MTPTDLYELSQRAASARACGDGALAHECWARIVEAVEAQAAHAWQAASPITSGRAHHTNRPGGVWSAPGLGHRR